MASRAEEKERRRQERLAAEASAAEATRRRRRLQIGAGAALVVAVAAAVAVAVASGGGGGSTHNPTTSPTGGAFLASTANQATGQPVDGIQCQSNEQLVYHIHAHLAVFVNGAGKLISAGIGIPPPRQVQQSNQGPFVVGGACFYWLHSHTQDGTIHIESPSPRIYTLGDYFDEWGQPLSSQQAGSARGPVTAFLNGKRYTGDPRSIPLKAHAVIQLDVGSPATPPQPFTFPGGL